MAARLPSLKWPPLLLLLLLCFCCSCLRPASALTDVNWPSLNISRVYNLTNLTDDQAYLVKETVRVAAARMESLLRVLELNPGRILLLNRTRSYCTRWITEDKCGQLNSTYLSTGDRCSPDSTFIIPQEYLSELAWYNITKIVVKTAGSGLTAFNFILFVTSQHTASCYNWPERPISVSTCSQQSSDRRPVAGLLNVCPQSVESELTTRSGRLLQHTLAGLVRLLGFSSSLMSDFQRRTPSAAVDVWERLTESDVLSRQGGLVFMQTPTVRNFAARHFNCSIGIPLVVDANAWNPAFLLPSILSAILISPGASGIDEATLSLLEDTGWYRANLSLADPILWGRRAGCWFSVRCSTQLSDPEPTFCSDTGSAVLRPDLSHRSEGRCSRINGTNCSAILPLEDYICPQPGNWRRLQLYRRGLSVNWTECLQLECETDSNASYKLTRNGSTSICRTGLAEVTLDGDIRVICPHPSLVCPRLSTVLDLLAGFTWQQVYSSKPANTLGPVTSFQLTDTYISGASSDGTSYSSGTKISTSDGTKASTSTSTSMTTASAGASKGSSTVLGTIADTITNATTITSTSISTSPSSSSVYSIASTSSSRNGTSSISSSTSSTGTVLNTSTSLTASSKASTRLSLTTASSDVTSLSSARTTPSVQDPHVLRQSNSLLDISSQQTSTSSVNRPSAKFSVRFAAMDYFELVKKDLVIAFKTSLQRSLAAAFLVSTELIIIHDVKPGSVIAIWENSDSTTNADSKLEIIKSKVKSGSIVVTINGVEFTATSVESYSGEDNSWSFPLMEVIIGSVVGALLLIGLILAIALVAMKHKLNRPRMQVQPRSTETSPTSSSQASRQCSAAPSGVIQLAFLGGGGAAPSARAVADVESTFRGGRWNGGQERGASAGSVGLQFSNSALYFDA